MNSTLLATALLSIEAAFADAEETAKLANGGKRKRKIPRSKQAVRREQGELQKRTKLAIDLLVAEYHAMMQRSKAKLIGAIYARYSSKFQSSIIDQVRELLDRALSEGIFVPRENVFYDLAVRGWKDRRPGLALMRTAIDKKQFKALLLVSTSRLYRRSYKSMEFVEEYLVGRGIRVIFVRCNLDTDDGDNWRSMLQVLGIVDEAQVRMMATQIHSSHEGLLIKGMVCMTLPLGFTGEDVAGELTKLKRPRQRIVIDLDTAVWIVRIFRWYLVEGLSIAAIARELNDDPEAPAPAKSINQMWTRTSVRNTLTNPTYRGCFSYGRKQSIWSSEKDYARQYERDEPLKTIYFEKLQIIPDEHWFEVQRLLTLEVSNSGRKPGDGVRKKQPRLLRGLFECPEHGRQLVASGDGGRVLLCPLCRALKPDKRPLFTHLNRQLAVQKTCETFAKLFEPSDDLVAKVIVTCQTLVDAVQAPDEPTLVRLRDAVSRLHSKIDFNRRNPGDTEAEQQQTLQLLRELRQEHAEAQAALASYESASDKRFSVPAEDNVVALLNELSQMLFDAQEAEDDQQLRLARRLIEELLDGKIELFQQGESKKGYGWLQGRAKVNPLMVLVKKLTGVTIDNGRDNWIEIIIDFKKPLLIDEQSEVAKRLWDEGLLHTEIAKQMGCIPPYVTKLIQYWHDTRGLPRPNNKKRRKDLENKQMKMPLYKEIANRVHEMMMAGLSNLEIARQTSTSDTNVAKAITWWHEKRGIPAPTATDRRNQKLKRAMLMLDGGDLLTDVAAELGYSARGLKLALDKFAGDNGVDSVDFRSRRGNAKSGATANGKNSSSASDAA